jgi:NAD+ diphosphatase
VEEESVTEAESTATWEAADRHFEPAVMAPHGNLGKCLFFAFQDDRLLVYLEPKGHLLPQLADFGDLDLPFTDPHYLGHLDDVHCFAIDLQTDAPPKDMALMGLRELYADFSEGIFQLAGRAFQIVNWDRTHHFCGRCGAKSNYHRSDRARQCPDCGLLSFPRVSPAVITLIHKGDEFLLARNARFPTGRYSIIAGFVEAGETLEEAVAREIKEEVGVDVTQITYQSSQPWPFPHSLMVGFTAAWSGGEICIDNEEIVEAGWFSAKHLPPSLPDGISISRTLIDTFLQVHS